MVQLSDAGFVEKVRFFITARGWTWAALAKSAGVSGAALSQFMSGKYPGDSGKLRAKLEGVIAREKDKSEHPRVERRFVDTSVASRVFEVARYCHVYGDIGVCYSVAGLGKTETAREYARQNPDVILIEADPGYTARVFFGELRDALGGASRATLHDVFEECCKRLKDSGRLLIIDEAEQLPYKALEMLRRLHDKTGIGILMTGMPKLLANLRGLKGEYAQLYSRVGLAVKLTPLTDKDTAAMLEMLLPDTGAALQKTFHKEAAGNARRLCKMAVRSRELSRINATAMSEEIVRAAAGMVRLEAMH